MPYVNNQGVRIYYRVVGSGPPLLLHHGFTQNLKRWYLCGYVEALSKSYQLILMDPRGHGGSDKPHEPDAYRLPLRIADVIAVLDGLGIDRVTFWGYSDGGRVGFGLAAEAPERVTALIVGGHDPYEKPIPEGGRWFVSDHKGVFVDWFLTMLKVDPSKLPPERRAELLANDFEALAAAVQHEPSVADTLPLMTMPTLIYAGEQDVFFADIERCVPLLPNVTCFWLPNLSHPIAFWQSSLVIPHVVTFLESPAVRERTVLPAHEPPNTESAYGEIGREL
jgi:pimeloyl-ACP methyl ester carboxylesterase